VAEPIEKSYTISIGCDVLAGMGYRAGLARRALSRGGSQKTMPSIAQVLLKQRKRTPCIVLAIQGRATLASMAPMLT
jgi:hypothetical protein